MSFAKPQLATPGKALGTLPAGRAGVRTSGNAVLRPLVEQGSPIGELAAGLIGRDCRAVRAILFDKSEAANWALGWHRTVQQGMQHVEPPFALIERMVTLRVHFDPVPAEMRGF